MGLADNSVAERNSRKLLSRVKMSCPYMAQIPVFYINLAARPDRRAFMESQLGKLGMEAKRIDALTPDDLTEEQRDTYCNPRQLHSMSERQYCCNLSHARAWGALLASRASVGLILEDDVILSASLPRFLVAVATQKPSLDVIRIETWPAGPKRYRSADYWALPEIGLRECLSWDAGAAGYILERDAALRLIDEPDLHTSLVDTMLFNPFGRVGRSLAVRQTDPGLCIQLMRSEPQASLASSDLAKGIVEYRGARDRNHGHRLLRRVNGWIGYDLPKSIARVKQIGWRDISTQSIPFSPD